ncbi:MAG: hypothetical protein OH338_01415 [Candidatus Parvarchaeota archaeon]|jgi:hypothetical protein|nr:hypothetical protein [Candidatus Parvarchaeum tengchongense]MCW1295826.1 hypothetical protein [Candidatus Parvarchaeum tengchongense]MCW1298977.1 hypothetical protein [Candidatus Parvarchaeum tengchongense]MCW1312073.1 hypothetical protein [Candidatus Parvarchaeum tengchongense]
MAVKLSDETISRIRRNVMNGVSRKDTAFTLNITYATVLKYTKDIAVPRRIVTDRQMYLLNRIASQGYFIPNSSDLSSLRLLKQRSDIHIATLGKKHIAFMKGRETEAIGAYLRHERISVISSHKLGQIERAFGLKDATKAKEALNDNDVRLTDYT